MLRPVLGGLVVAASVLALVACATPYAADSTNPAADAAGPDAAVPADAAGPDGATVSVPCADIDECKGLEACCVSYDGDGGAVMSAKCTASTCPADAPNRLACASASDCDALGFPGQHCCARFSQPANFGFYKGSSCADVCPAAPDSVTLCRLGSECPATSTCAPSPFSPGRISQCSN